MGEEPLDFDRGRLVKRKSINLLLASLRMVILSSLMTFALCWIYHCCLQNNIGAEKKDHGTGKNFGGVAHILH